MRGDCASVATIGEQVQLIDSEFYSTIFVVHPIVARCARPISAP
jgi:hypothetical protein